MTYITFQHCWNDQLAVLDELVSRYTCDGVEYDFACAPGGGAAGVTVARWPHPNLFLTFLASVAISNNISAHRLVVPLS